MCPVFKLKSAFRLNLVSVSVCACVSDCVLYSGGGSRTLGALCAVVVTTNVTSETRSSMTARPEGLLADLFGFGATW